MPQREVSILNRQFRVVSFYLKREVVLDAVLYTADNRNSELPVIFMNDGQDIEALGLSKSLNDFSLKNERSFLCVAIHSSQERLQEYGVAGYPDYANRGSKASNYSNFILKELIPYLKLHFSIKNNGHSIFGFSLGGLSAFDLTIEHQNVFTKVGVFSGAFWWRSRDLGPAYSDEHDRIMHQKLKRSSIKSELGCWFQCGTLDEKTDRNKNGIIDSIDDTMDIISILKKKGVENVVYREVVNGKHNHETWKKVIPEFLLWLGQ